MKKEEKMKIRFKNIIITVFRLDGTFVNWCIYVICIHVILIIMNSYLKEQHSVDKNVV